MPSAKITLNFAQPFAPVGCDCTLCLSAVGKENLPKAEQPNSDHQERHEWGVAEGWTWPSG